MMDHCELKAFLSDTGCSIIAYCDNIGVACVGHNEYEAILRLKDIVNFKCGMIFPNDMKNC